MKEEARDWIWVLNLILIFWLLSLKKNNQQNQTKTKHTVNEKLIIFQEGFSIREAGDKNPQLLNNPV